ncbi:MAG: hypothetical protein JXB32_21430 [Deltaproteobacteria bacterium]|nr:hypothetical protein [Deltaproteobacteria bacterium]
MNNRTIWMLAALLAALAVVPGISCGDDDDDIDVTTDDAGTDDTGDTTETTTGNCPETPDPAVPELRLRTLTILSPTAMRNAVLQQLIFDSMENEDFLWLIRFTGKGTGTMTLRTGSGQEVAGRACTYSYLPAPYAPGEMQMTETGLSFALLGDPIAQIDVPMWSEGTAYPDPPLLTLPLRNLDIGGTFSADYLYIGSYNEGTDEWTEAGTLSGAVTAADAQATIIEDLGMTMCGLLSGSTGAPSNPADDCDGGPPGWDPTSWLRPPDTEVGGEPAYSMTATFAASAVYIQD